MREYADESSIINKLDLDTSRKIFEEVSKSNQNFTDEIVQLIDSTLYKLRFLK